jgi:hypothetical protein
MQVIPWHNTRVASGVGLPDRLCTTHALILLALKFVFSLILLLRDEMRAPPATLHNTILTKRTVKISAWTPASESFPWGACHVYP